MVDDNAATGSRGRRRGIGGTMLERGRRNMVEVDTQQSESELARALA